MSLLTHLQCSKCGQVADASRLQTICACGKPLLARYDLERASRIIDRDSLAARESNLWRYFELLPVHSRQSVVSLGEGWTPLLAAPRLGARLGVRRLYVKDESRNPTGSFKARGMTTAVSVARDLGATALAVPSAGNAAGALAAYAARAGLAAHVFMPADTPRANQIECEIAGATVTLVDGLITDCARFVAERREKEAWFDVSTLREPYRLEGKKTMGYELAEQLGWDLPEVIVYPTGGGTGLIGMWKAFDEMEQLGWIDSRRPRLISVQAAGCAPIVRAYSEGLDYAPSWDDAQTIASGLRVPRALADFLILRVVRASGGCAVAVEDESLIAGAGELAASEGVFAAPEGGACVAALRTLVASGEIDPEERVVLFNTGSGVKYLEAFS